MVIKSLYKDYFQKSRVFLYPALEIRRGVSVTPIETYVSWEGRHNKDDMKLCCLYHLRNDPDFIGFEKTKLLGNKLFHTFYKVGDNKGLYIFDFTLYRDQWNHFIAGKYSRLSADYKRKIKNYIGPKQGDAPYIDSFLNPEKYFKLYAEMINVKEDLLKEVGELCDRPNFELETLKVSIENLQIITEKS